ncbi:MAG: GNAT family N-acetyltransferase [Pyrinomonadaceae bacterium]
MILQTTRLNVRELNSASDAEFICALLNTPKFIKYIGDRGVRTADDAAAFIDDRYRQSYRDHGYGLYAVELKDGTRIGMCGFVRRDTLPGPDIGFAFLPEFERRGFGYESAAAMMKYGHDAFGFTTVYAITSPDNDASGSLLEKLGFTFDKLIPSGDETVKLFVSTI